MTVGGGVGAAVATVGDRLSVRRDAAAAALVFEFAARLQRELEALAWVTAGQKVTRATADNFDFCDWADDLLILFTVGDGRLRLDPARVRYRDHPPP